MAEAYKLYSENVASVTPGSGTVAYTVPSATTAIVRSIYVCNLETTVDHAVNIEVNDGGTNRFIVKGVAVPMQSTLQPLSGSVVLEAGDKLEFSADAAGANDLDVCISVLEIS
tara:strand:- start:209 stop:547 length:339 start_codon:yes stop_codon:yes gene_type:complete